MRVHNVPWKVIQTVMKGLHTLSTNYWHNYASSKNVLGLQNCTFDILLDWENVWLEKVYLTHTDTASML